MAPPVPVAQAAPVDVAVSRDGAGPQQAAVVATAASSPTVVVVRDPATASTAATLGESANTAAGGIGAGVKTMMTSSQTQTMSVTVPAGIKPGQTFTFLTPAGQQMAVTCPANAAPGSQLVVPVRESIGTGTRLKNGAAQMYDGLNAAAGTAQRNARGPFGRTPRAMQCPSCGQHITTVTHLESGTTTWVVAGGTCLFGCWLGCCLIPFYIDDLKDCKHHCPACNAYLGKNASIG